MPRKTVLALLVVTIAFMGVLGVAGCKSASQKMVGTWAPTLGSNFQWTFGADGKFSQESSAAPGGLPSRSGTWSMNGNHLEMKIDSSGASVTTSATVDWVNDDHIKVNIGQMAPLEFNRQK